MKISIIRDMMVMALAAITFVQCGTINEELPSYEATSKVGVGDIAPDFTVTLLDGEELTLSSLRGEVVAVVFFSHTCPDCKALFDDIEAAKEEIGSRGIRLIAISRGGTMQDIETYIEANGYTFDVACDAQREVYDDYATMYVPRLYLIDRKGVVDMLLVEYQEDYIDMMLGRVSQL